MNINEYILNEVTALGLSQTVKEAKKLFHQFPFTHFPVIENQKLLGSFAEDDIQTIEDEKDTLLNNYHLMQPFFADEKDSILDLLSIFATNNSNIVPVLNKEKLYIGYYDLCDVLDVFTSIPFFTDESQTLVVRKNEKDFSMSEIAQIVESNGSSLLGNFISKREEDFVEVTLNIAGENINEVMHTFRRYNYSIQSSIDNDAYLEDLKNRSDYLKRYLEM